MSRYEEQGEVIDSVALVERVAEAIEAEQLREWFEALPLEERWRLYSEASAREGKRG